MQQDSNRLMKEAAGKTAVDAMVKSGSYRQALDAYLAIYQEHGNIAAAINASIVYEGLGETQTAASFMQGVFAATGSPKVRDVLNRLNMELGEAAGAATFDEAQSQVERVAMHASEEIQKVLPQDARVWIANNAANDNMLSAVVDNITADFIRRGICVVDRDHSLLISAEQNYQLSGFVSDDYFVSVGNAAGANIIAVIGITGTGAMRRMQVRVLDVERGVPIFQSDTNEAWGL